MKRANQKLIAAMAALLVSGTATQAILFQDTFNAGPAFDINTDYAARQAGGAVSAQYTGNQSWYGLSGSHLVHSGGGEIALDANLASGIVGNDFEFSFKQTMLNTNNNWSAIYLASATEPTRGNSRVGLHTWGTAQLAAVYTVYGGIGAAGAAYTQTARSPAQMNALWQTNFGTDFDRTAEHTIQFISTPGAGGTNTFDFVVDGVVVIDNKQYAFNDDTVRNIEMVGTIPSHADGSNGVLYDDLTVIPEPATLGMVAFVGAGILFVRRRFMI